MTLYRTLIIGAFAACSVIPSAAFAQSPIPSTESVVDFSATATLTSNRKLTVVETIEYDFGINERHGIYRTIPTSYSRNGGNYSLTLSLIQVTMDGASVPYTVQSRSPEFRIQIGDPNKTITGVHTYVISYETDRAINFFNGEGELYWNVTGNGWEVPIGKASFSLVGPASYDATTASSTCFTGPVGSTASDCAISAQANTVQVSTKGSLNAEDNLTLALRFPKGIIAEPSLLQKIAMLVADNWILVVPILVFAFMFWRWWQVGRDPKGRGTIVPQYEPPRGLAPIEMAALMKQDVGPAAITATIIDLARRGYLKINFGEKEGLLKKTETYAFTQLKQPDETLASFEDTILRGLFVLSDTVKLEDLKGTFYKTISLARDQAFRSLREKGLFGRNPVTVRASYFGVAAVTAFIGFYASGMLGALATISLILSGGIIAVFGWFMPSKTKEGAVALEEAEGFKWFLSVTEKDRLKFTDAPALKPEQFHQFLPSAIAFSVEEQWVKQFAGMDIPEPTYVSGYGVWNALIFTNAMHSMGVAAAANAYTPPSQAGAGGSGFGGGGFSGGGFGGGGGGSW